MTSYESDTSNLGKLGKNSRQTVDTPVVDLTQGDGDSISDEPYQVHLPGDVVLSLTHQKKHAANYQRDFYNDFIATERQFFSAQSEQQRLPTSTINPVDCGPAVEQVNAFRQEQGRQAEQYRQERERFGTTARLFEAGARDELQSETARVNVESQYDTKTRIHHMETGAESIFLQHQMCLISQLASEAT